MKTYTLLSGRVIGFFNNTIIEVTPARLSTDELLEISKQMKADFDKDSKRYLELTGQKKESA